MYQGHIFLTQEFIITRQGTALYTQNVEKVTKRLTDFQNVVLQNTAGFYMHLFYFFKKMRIKNFHTA